jgi:hypothetical protein
MTRLTAEHYREFRRQIEQEKHDRIREFEDEIANDARMAVAKAAAPAVLRMLAQGDSWFDYLPGGHVDIVAHLASLTPLTPKILKLAHYGEATEDMLGLKKLSELRDQLRNPKAAPFDAILFSGGGNDLAGNQFRLWLTERTAAGGNPSAGLNGARVAAVLGVIRAGYEDLIATRDAFASSAWIFTTATTSPSRRERASATSDRGCSPAWPTGDGARSPKARQSSGTFWSSSMRC